MSRLFTTMFAFRLALQAYIFLRLASFIFGSQVEYEPLELLFTYKNSRVYIYKIHTHTHTHNILKIYSLSFSSKYSVSYWMHLFLRVMSVLLYFLFYLFSPPSISNLQCRKGRERMPQQGEQIISLKERNILPHSEEVIDSFELQVQSSLLKLHADQLKRPDSSKHTQRLILTYAAGHSYSQ